MSRAAYKILHDYYERHGTPWPHPLESDRAPRDVPRPPTPQAGEGVGSLVLETDPETGLPVFRIRPAKKNDDADPR